MTDLERARQQVAARYPEALTDTHGRQHPNIPRQAILAGHWDAGGLVREALASLDDKA